MMRKHSTDPRAIASRKARRAETKARIAGALLLGLIAAGCTAFALWITPTGPPLTWQPVAGFGAMVTLVVYAAYDPDR